MSWDYEAINTAKIIFIDYFKVLRFVHFSTKLIFGPFKLLKAFIANFNKTN